MKYMHRLAHHAKTVFYSSTHLPAATLFLPSIKLENNRHGRWLNHIKTFGKHSLHFQIFPLVLMTTWWMQMKNIQLGCTTNEAHNLVSTKQAGVWLHREKPSTKYRHQKQLYINTWNGLPIKLVMFGQLVYFGVPNQLNQRTGDGSLLETALNRIGLTYQRHQPCTELCFCCRKCSRQSSLQQETSELEEHFTESNLMVPVFPEAISISSQLQQLGLLHEYNLRVLKIVGIIFNIWTRLPMD